MIEIGLNPAEYGARGEVQARQQGALDRQYARRAREIAQDARRRGDVVARERDRGRAGQELVDPLDPGPLGRDQGQGVLRDPELDPGRAELAAQRAELGHAQAAIVGHDRARRVTQLLLELVDLGALAWCWHRISPPLEMEIAGITHLS